MRAVSEAFLDAVKASHIAITRIDAIYNGVVTKSNLAITGGSVTIDRNSDVRGRCSVTFADQELIPTDPSSVLSPYGQEIQIWRGIRTSSGDELVPLGIFRIESGQVSDPSPQIPVSGFDRSQGLKEADFWQPWTVDAGGLYTDAIQAMVLDVYPAQQFRFASFGQTVPSPLLYQEGVQGGRWSAIQEIATALGAEVFFDGNGVMVLQPEPDPTGTSRFLLTDGEDGVAVETSRNWSRTDVYNGVVAVSSNPANPDVRALVTDDDPTSPTQWGGPFGKKVKRWASPLLTSNDMAAASATSILRRVKGATQQVGIKTWPNPAIEPGDVVTIRRADLALETSCIVDYQQIGLLESDAMTLQARSQQTTYSPAPIIVNPPPVEPPPVIVVGPTLLYSDNFRNQATSKFVARTSTGVNSGLWPVTNGSSHKYRPSQVAWDSSLGLVITALWDGAQWWSGLVDTRYVWDFPMPGVNSGGVKARFRWKCPVWQGLWSTGWAFPKAINTNTDNGAYGGWPRSGEWDWMESGKTPQQVTGAIHEDNPFQSGTPYDRGVSLQTDYSTDYVITEAEYIPGTGFNWYHNGVKYGSVPWSQIPHPPQPWDQNFYPIFNMAVGGNYVGTPATPATGTTFQFIVDYLEIYAL